MIVNSEPKLDYSDVLIVPQISNVKSRKDVSLEVNKTFKNKSLNKIELIFT